MCQHLCGTGQTRDVLEECFFHEGANMPYRADCLAIDEEATQEELDRFPNPMEGELRSIIPCPVPKLQEMGTASKVKFFFVVERVT